MHICTSKLILETFCKNLGIEYRIGSCGRAKQKTVAQWCILVWRGQARELERAGLLLYDYVDYKIEIEKDLATFANCKCLSRCLSKAMCCHPRGHSNVLPLY